MSIDTIVNQGVGSRQEISGFLDAVDLTAQRFRENFSLLTKGYPASKTEIFEEVLSQAAASSYFNSTNYILVSSESNSDNMGQFIAYSGRNFNTEIVRDKIKAQMRKPDLYKSDKPKDACILNRFVDELAFKISEDGLVQIYHPAFESTQAYSIDFNNMGFVNSK